MAGKAGEASTHTTPAEIADSTTADVEITPDATEAPEATVQAELEETRKALRKANREAAERRKKLEEYEKADNERKQAAMSELEKLQAKVTEMETRAKQAEAARDLLVKQRQFYAAIGKAKLQFASDQAKQDATALVDLSEMDKAGIEGLVKDLETTRPYLFGPDALPDIDGKKRGKAAPADAKEEAIKAAAIKYGFGYVPPD